MKPISNDLKNHLKGEVTTLATCWKATLTNGTVYGFTDNIKDLEIGGITYVASTGYTPSSIATSGNLAVDNLEVQGLLNSDVITEADLLAGLWDYAEIEIFLVNYADLSQGALILRKGTVGNVQYNRNTFVAEMRGLTQAFQNILGQVTTPTCRVEFTSAKCGLSASAYTVTGAITSISSNRLITDTSRTEATDFFKYGKITFTSGNNVGYSMEVKEFTSGGVIELVLPLPYEMQVGDTYDMIRGCSKTFAACKAYNNVINFRGEPHVPGIDKAIRYGNK